MTSWVRLEKGVQGIPDKSIIFTNWKDYITADRWSRITWWHGGPG